MLDKYRYSGATRVERAQHIWLGLVAWVGVGKLFDSPPRLKGRDMKFPWPRITYGDLILFLGFSAQQAGRSIGEPLYCIYRYCKRNELPALNYLVVNQDSGKPGWGRPEEIDENAYAKSLEEIKRRNWLELKIPTVGDFSDPEL